MKILIPTDFSKLSRVAVHFAAKMAKKLDAEIVLLNVIFISAPPRAMVAVKVKAIEDAMVDNAKQDSIQLVKELKAENRGKLNISYEIIKGYPIEDAVESFAIHNKIDLIIMGTKGATGLTKVLIGSNAASVINNSDIPVITVPEFARFNNLKHIVYATDVLNLNKELNKLVPFAKLFDATIHILHIVSPKSKKKFNTAKTIVDKLKIKYPKITFHVSVNDDILEGIDEYIADTKADMLTMFTHNLTFFEKLFGKSVTRQMTFHSWIPLFAIKKHNYKS
ncbi:MAG: universal stress protein [Lewinellaceae bacterium]|nr:universal stress protein [Lewinellaceae bacterium]